ncbi:MAG: hypothetical protein MAG551_02032 [Candidatus Scalindua arabica]|uniref:HTH cro/C1-type domain-containing protein n=1 Tax=Candidatus Scalindua arabica TaxID=1127984 RepID=A0A941W472_9BACT|nr:hypothetical protein [Candidatus Scalindua arabica]
MPYKNFEKQFLLKIGLAIKEFRLQKELSQEKLAFKCDLDRTYIGSVERGERNISVLNLKKIADALDIKISQLFSEYKS